MKKKIAIIGAKGLPGIDGISCVVENYIKYLTDIFDFTIFCSEEYTDRKSGKYDGYEEIVLKKIKNIRLNTLWYYIKSTWIILFTKHFDLIHFHHCDSAFLFPIIRIKYGKRLVVTTHGAFTKINDKWKNYKIYFIIQYHFFLRFSPYITSVSKNEQLKTKLFLKRDSKFISNGINIKVKVSDENVGNNYIFFSAGRIIEIKCLDVLLKALHQIDYKGLVKVAGDISKSSEKYKRTINELSKNLNIEFLGMIKEKSLLYKYLKSAILFIFPSNAETMSIQLLEAVSLKVPIIASDIVENTDLLEPDEVLFFKTDDSINLAQKILFALSNIEELKLRAEKAYKKLESKYTWEIIAESYCQVYYDILK